MIATFPTLTFETAPASKAPTNRSGKKFSTRTPLADFLFDWKIKVINERSVHAYQVAYRQAFVKAKLESETKARNLGSFWFWSGIIEVLYFAVFVALACFTEWFWVAGFLGLFGVVKVLWKRSEHGEDQRDAIKHLKLLEMTLRRSAKWRVHDFAEFSTNCAHFNPPMLVAACPVS